MNANNQIFCGDNLQVLKTLASTSVDLIYLDPPYNSGRDYGEFDDRWDSMDAYIEFMRVRAVELHRLLKPTGSVYLHCDPTSSHYLKVMLDGVFGIDNFRNEIIWFYATGGASKRHWARKHDVILFYSKTDQYKHTPLRQKVLYKKAFFETKIDENGQHYNEVIARDVWTDIKPSIQPNERVGYPTQKPLPLLGRIINAATHSGDMVLDPFCGSGTTLVTAKTLNRRWAGIDSSATACAIAQQRLDSILI